MITSKAICIPSNIRCNFQIAPKFEERRKDGSNSLYFGMMKQLYQHRNEGYKKTEGHCTQKKKGTCVQRKRHCRTYNMANVKKGGRKRQIKGSKRNVSMMFDCIYDGTLEKMTMAFTVSLSHHLYSPKVALYYHSFFGVGSNRRYFTV